MIKRAKHTKEEAYHILWCISELVCLDLLNVDESKKENLSKLFDIVNYLNTCKCKHCRNSKTFKAWLKEIRNPKSYYRLK